LKFEIEGPSRESLSHFVDPIRREYDSLDDAGGLPEPEDSLKYPVV
jgi:hypothetical protein